MSKQILDFFWKLASDNENDRVEAAVGLLDTLIKTKSEEDWEYSFKRLVKGLSSPRGSSRIGFSMALTELLNVRAENITISKYLDALTEHTKISGKVKGHEERALHFGRLFGIQSLANSQLITQDSITMEDFESVVNLTLDLANSKAWLRESCFFSLCLLVNKLPETSLDSDSAIKFVLKAVDKLNFTTTSEGVALYLSIPEEKRHEFGVLENGWKDGDPLAKGNTIMLAKALKEIDTSQNTALDGNTEETSKSESNKKKSKGKGEDESAKQKGNWKPKLHFVWAKLALFFNGPHNIEDEPKSKKHKSKKSKSTSNTGITHIKLDEFWKAVIDESFFSSTSSNERKFWGFEVFSLFLQVLTNPDDVKILFCANFMRTFVNQLAQKDRYLHRVAQKAATVITEVGAARPELIPTLLAALMTSKQGSTNFDQLTRTKTTQKLFSCVQTQQVPEVVNLLISVLIAPDETEQKAVEGRRQWALDNLLQLIRTHSNNEATEWIDNVLEILIREGYFTSSKKAEKAAKKDKKKRKHEDSEATVIEVGAVTPPFTEKTIEQCQKRLISTITATVGVKRADCTSWAYRALHTILKFEQNDKEYRLRTPFEGDLLKAKDKAVKTLEKVRKKRLSSPHADNSQLEAFELLFSLVLLQVYSTDSEAASVLEELQLCYNTILGKSKIEESGDEHEEIDASQILTEILLSFMSQQSMLLRKISETVWETFSSRISRESLMLLYDVLATKESKEGQGEMFESDEEEGDDDEEDEEDDADDEDEDDEEDEDDSDSSDDEKETNDKVEELERTANKALAKALGISGEDVEMEDDDENDDVQDDDEESMDDEQMMALDDQLATIFRERQKALNEHGTIAVRKRSQDAKTNMVHFKARVIDLLDIYIKAQPSSPLILTAVIPLISIVKTSNDKALIDRAHTLLKSKLCKIKSLPILKTSEEDEKVGESDEEDSDNDETTLPNAPITANDLVAWLVSIHTMARKSNRVQLSLACNQASVFLSKILLTNDMSHAEHVVAIYSQSLSDWLERPNSKTQPALFFEFINWVNSARAQLHKSAKTTE